MALSWPFVYPRYSSYMNFEFFAKRRDASSRSFRGIQWTARSSKRFPADVLLKLMHFLQKGRESVYLI